MDYENVLRWKGKAVKIVIKKGWRYRGIIVALYKDSILLDDIVDGNLTLLMSEILSICDLKENGRNR